MGYLELPVVELGAVLEEELVGAPEARLDAVLDHGAGPGRTRQFLYLKNKQPKPHHDTSTAVKVQFTQIKKIPVVIFN